MIEQLLQAKKISPAQFDIYMLYQANELGRKILSEMTMAYFMDEPMGTEFQEAGFAFYAGRCSVFRDIHKALIFVKKQLTENNHDGTSQ